MEAVGINIIIEKLPMDSKSDGGFEWTGKDTKEMRYQKGKVITTGNDVKRVKDGDVIYYDQHRAYDTSIEGRTVTVLREVDVVVRLD